MGCATRSTAVPGKSRGQDVEAQRYGSGRRKFRLLKLLISRGNRSSRHRRANLCLPWRGCGNADLTKAANRLPGWNRHSCGTPRPRNLTLSGRSPGSRVVAFITRLPGTHASDTGAIGSPLTVAGQLRFHTGFPLSFHPEMEDHDGGKLSLAKVKSSCHRGLCRKASA